MSIYNFIGVLLFLKGWKIFWCCELWIWMIYCISKLYIKLCSLRISFKMYFLTSNTTTSSMLLNLRLLLFMIWIKSNSFSCFNWSKIIWNKSRYRYTFISIIILIDCMRFILISFIIIWIWFDFLINCSLINNLFIYIFYYI